MQTRDQVFAQDVYKRVLAIKDQDEAFRASYGSMAHKLPILIHTSGLVQALTFVDTRKDAGPERLLQDLSQTVLADETVGKEQLLKRARGDSDESSDNLRSYIYLTKQVLAALLWYKRYSQSILNIEDQEK